MIKVAVYCCALMLLLVSCTDKYDMPLNAESTKLVVFGEITTDTMAHRIKLTRTTEFYTKDPAIAISNAQVTIHNGTSVISLSESPDEPGAYYTLDNYYGEEGKHYVLFISNVDVNNDGITEFYEAESTMPVSGDVYGLFLSRIDFGQQFRGWGVHLLAADPVSTDFYRFLVYKNGKLLSDSIMEWTIQDDLLFNGSFINGPMVNMLSEDKAEERLRPGDIVTLEVNYITKDFFNYIYQIREVRFQNPFIGGPPANVLTNISNGAVGIFTTYSVKRITVMYAGNDSLP